MSLSGVSTHHVLRVPNNSLKNLEQAVLQRVLLQKETYGTGQLRWVEPSNIDQDILFDLLSFQHKFICDNTPVATKWSYDKVIDSYLARKRTLYINAYEKIKNRGLRTSDSHLMVFSKCEKLSKNTARVVSPRSYQYSLELARYIKPLEKMIYRTIDKMYGAKTVMKGLNAVQIAACIKSSWDSFDKPVAVGLDISRFDQRVSRSYLLWKHSIYRRCYPNDKKLRMLSKMQLNNKCFGNCPDGKLKYTVDGQLMSGDQDTSLTGVLIMCSLVHALLRETNVKARLINCGDDCVVIMSRHDLPHFAPRVRSFFVSAYMDVKIEAPVYELEHIEFCQTHPVNLGDTHVMVRNVSMAVAKDSMCIRSMQSTKEFQGWLACVAKGGLALAGGCPIFDSFYNCLLRASSGAKPIYTAYEDEGLYKMGYKMSRISRDPSHIARSSFAFAFGIVPELQIQIEKYYDSYTPDCRTMLLLDSVSPIAQPWF